MVLHTNYVLRVQYGCGVVLVFLVLAGYFFDVTYVLSVQYSCTVVSVFCCGRKTNLVRIFFLNPNFLLVHRNKLSVTVYLLFADRGFLFLHNTLLLCSLSPY